ncbi:MAG: DNA polymerase III subunit alpha [Armatimonadota bacterium]|jgi:error-prone DNA polymerase
MDFVHLHLHSVFSFLDSTCAVDRLIARVKELGMSAVAVTDHDGMYGAVRFYRAAKAAGIKPILGVELTTEGGFHLTLLAMSKRGYGNLCRMITAGHFRVLREAECVGQERASCPNIGSGAASAASYRSNKSETPLGSQWRKAPRCSFRTIAQCAADVIALSGCRFGEVQAAVRRGDMEGARRAVRRFQNIFGRERFFIELTLEEGERDRMIVAALAALAQEMGAPAVATANVHYLAPEEAPIQDVLACIQTLTTRSEWHPIRRVEPERYLKSPREMERAFSHHPDALRNTARIAEMCDVDLGLGKLHFPHFRMRRMDGFGTEVPKHQFFVIPSEARNPVVPSLPDWFPQPDQEVEGETAERLLEWLCRRGVERRCTGVSGFPIPKPRCIGSTVLGSEIPKHHKKANGEIPRSTRNDKGPIAKRLHHELTIIRDLGLCEYFLVVWDIVEEARARGIRCSGRGSAADSLVSYLLGITDVDPIAARLLFERFLNPERRGMPDIDIDFDSRRRDEMLEYVATRYGAEHTGMVATVNTYNARSAIREVGKAIELPEPLIDHISTSMPYIPAGCIRQAIATLPELRGSGLDLDALKELFDICEAIDGFPRHLSVHLGGVVISRDRITDATPLEVSTKGVIVSQFDKDDIEALGLVKMDLLGLRNLAAIDESVHMIRETRGVELDLEHLPLDDEKTFELIRSARTVGVFQLESPGMRGLVSQLQPTRFDDIIAQVSLFRPGPMQADMIRPFLARRHGKEPVRYIHPAVKPALEDTYGVILYQEQVLEVASALAGLSLGESDTFRRAMTHGRSADEMDSIRGTFMEGCRTRGVEESVAQEAFRQLSAFAAYGFCKAHAAQFAIIAYQTAYLKAHYPAEFLASILSNQPMGFYPPEVIVQEAKHFGVEMRPVDINTSRDRYWVEEGAIRVALQQVRGLSAAGMKAILAARKDGPFLSLRGFCARTGLARPMVEHLILAGAFDSLGNRRRLLWELNEICETGARQKDRKQEVNGQLALEAAVVGQEHVSCPKVTGVSVGAGLCSRSVANGGRPWGVAPTNGRNGIDLSAETERDAVASELSMTGVSVRRHPLYFAREKLRELGVVSRSQLDRMPDGKHVKVAGVVISRQRPPIKSGRTVIFITMEDETGLLDVTVFERVYEQWGKVIYSNSCLIVDGTLQKKGRYGTVIIGERFQGLKP